MKRNEQHRPERFIGIANAIPRPAEVRDVSGTTNSLKPWELSVGSSSSPVEAQICFGETVRELGDYLSGLTDAEMLAVQAQTVYPDGDLIKRMKERLGVADERLAEIREEMRNIIFG